MLQQQKQTMPLSQITMDDSSPPVVHYGTHKPVAVSTPTGTDVHVHSSQQKDSYQQIIPCIPQGSNNEVLSLCDKVSKGLDKYLQDTEQCHALEVNYFDDTLQILTLYQKPQSRSPNLPRTIYPQPSKSLWRR